MRGGECVRRKKRYSRMMTTIKMTLLYTANQHANKRNDQLVTPKKTAQPGEKYYKRTLHIISKEAKRDGRTYQVVVI